MNEFCKKLSDVLKMIFGYGIMICLFAGGLTFFGYVAAFILGGDAAVMICDFIYNKIFKVLIYGGNIIVLLGLAHMYLKKQKFLSMEDTSHEAG